MSTRETFARQGRECLVLLPQAKLVGAQSRLRSVDVELLTKLCKELRQQFSDEVSYDGARPCIQNRSWRKLRISV